MVSTWVTLMPFVSVRRRYVRFGFGRNNYRDCADCVAHPSRVIRLEFKVVGRELVPLPCLDPAFACMR